MRYPGPDGKLNTQDDLFTVNDLHFVKNRTALIYLKSSDVIHSFFLPQMRIKQDAVPGLTIPVWFDADTAGKYDLACAELCGWGHYKMRANVTVHETPEEFQKWLDEKLAEQNQSQLTMATDSQEGDRHEFGSGRQWLWKSGGDARSRGPITATAMMTSIRRPRISFSSTSSRTITRSSASSSCSRR